MAKHKPSPSIKPFMVSPMAMVMIVAVVLVIGGLFMARQIDLTTADLGRHIRNGEIFVKELNPVTTNHYSFTEPSRPVVNHHWGAGVIYYFVYRIAGFSGLSMLNIFLFSLTLLVFLRMALARSDLRALLLSLLMLPLLTNRAEVRPELYSFLLAGIVWSILMDFREGKGHSLILYLLPAVFLLWVNLHIFFVIGLVMIVVVLGDRWLHRDMIRVRRLGVVLAVALLACLANPSGIRGLTEPFLILREYGYRIAENQTLFFMQGLFPRTMLYIHFELAGVVFIVLALIRIVRKKTVLLPELPGIVMLFLFLLGGMAMIRMMTFFGFFFIPVVAELWKRIPDGQPQTNRKRAGIAFLVLSLALVLGMLLGRNNHFSAITPRTGLGWDSAHDGSGRFFTAQNLQGPVLNNYDIGGYLIFHLFPRERVFVDNRPEAYSVAFFREVYEPLQASEQRWHAIDSIYRFNVIFFNRLDNADYAQGFLIRRAADSAWVPVYFDDRTIIMVRNDLRNQAVIEQYGLSKAMFGGSR